jgi:hypothetical protein
LSGIDGRRITYFGDKKSAQQNGKSSAALFRLQFGKFVVLGALCFTIRILSTCVYRISVGLSKWMIFEFFDCTPLSYRRNDITFASAFSLLSAECFHENYSRFLITERRVFVTPIEDAFPEH